MKLAFVLSSIFFLFFGNSKFKEGTHAIQSGEYVQHIKYGHFMVAIQVTRGDKTFLCGGAIFSKIKFVTAAHCLFNMTSATVSLGSLNPFAGLVTFNLTHYKLHPYWNNSRAWDHDIAVGYFPVELVFGEYINRVEVVEQNYIVHENLQVAAYGYGKSSQNSINPLMWTVVNVMNFQDCWNSYSENNEGKLHGNIHFCLGPTQDHINHVDVGDSGGPILECQTSKLVGIISSSLLGKPDIGIMVTGYRQFLENPYEFECQRSLPNSEEIFNYFHL